MVFKWKDEHIPLFLEYYKNYPCLWDIKLSTYKDRDVRESAIKSLIKDLNIEGVTYDDVRIKIRNIRSRYCVEFKRVQWARKCGRAYVPRLHWFHQADAFLNAVYLARDTPIHKQRRRNKMNKILNNIPLLDVIISSVESINSNSSLSSSGDNKRFKSSPSNRSSQSQELWIEDQPLANLKKSPSEEMNHFQSVNIQEISSWSNSSRYTNNQANNSHPENLLEMEDRVTTLRQDDECDIVGKNVAAKLRSLPPMQRIYAEKIINDTLHGAQLNTLSRFSRLNNPAE